MARATLAAFTLYTLADLSRTVTDQLPPGTSVKMKIEPKGTEIELSYPEVKGEDETTAARRAVDLLTNYFQTQPDLDAYYVTWQFFGATVTVKIGDGYYPVKSSTIKGEAE